MQTRRDQLQAYRFQNRRALAALVSGEPNAVEPPMRRLTVTTLSGIMIAVLAVVAFALVGYIKPATGNKWKAAGAIIVERETGARYIYDHQVLHPVLNYTSAVLAVGTAERPHVVLVDRSDLKGAKRGATIGIDGIPDSLPSAGSLVDTPWTVCSRQQTAAGSGLSAAVDVRLGDDAGARALPADEAVLVRAAASGARFLLYGGQRLPLDSDAVLASLGFPTTSVLTVGTAFLDGVPSGPPLRVPEVTDAGRPGPLVGGRATRIGQLLATTGPDRRSYLLLDGGAAQLDPVQAALFATLPIGAGGRPLDPLQVTESAVLALGTSPPGLSALTDRLKGLPNHIPAVSADPVSAGGLCAIYRNGAASPAFAVPANRLPPFANGSVGESDRSRRGLADSVVLAPGRAALVRSRSGASTVFLIADPGRRFPVSSAKVLAGFGYAPGDIAPMPAQLLLLVPTGPALDPSAALRPVGG